MSAPTTPADSSSRPPGRRLYFWLWLAVSLAALHTVLTLTGFGPWRLELGSLLRLTTGLIAVPTIVLLGLRHYRRGRASTLWLGASAGVWWFGDAAYGFVEVIARQDVRQYSVLGLPYLLAVFMMMVAVMLLPKPARSRNEVLSIWAETMIVIVASITAMWRGFIAQNLVDQDWNWIAVTFDLIGPFFGMGVLGFLLLTVLRQRERILGAYNWLALGVLCFGAVMLGADFIRGQGGQYFTGHPIDALGSWGNVLLLTAVLTGLRPRVEQHPILTRTWASSLTALPYLAVVASYVTMYTLLTSGGNDPNHEIKELGLLIGVGIVTALVVLRQLLMIVENKNLNESLERRVAERGLELEVSQARLNASERLASLGQLTGGIAHEVNTPLAATMNFLHQANNLSEEYKQSIGAPGVTNADHLEIANELKGNIGSAQTTLERLGEFVRSIRNQGRSLGAGSSNYNLVGVVRDTVNMLEFEARKVQVEMQFESSSDSVIIHGEPGRIAQIVQNLIGNAIHACESRRAPGGSVVTVRLARQLTGQTQGMGVPVPSERVVLSVQDNGSGIPPEVLPRIFEPLYSTKEIGRGTGLGLSIIRDIVTGHLGGEINLETNMGQRTTFTVSFPVAHTPQIELAAARHFEPSRNTVVIGED